jgi:hypothetical protein
MMRCNREANYDETTKQAPSLKVSARYGRAAGDWNFFSIPSRRVNVHAIGQRPAPR